MFDGRKRRIRALGAEWRYYAQITVEDPNSGKEQARRVPLEGATTVAQALIKLNDLERGILRASS